MNNDAPAFTIVEDSPGLTDAQGFAAAGVSADVRGKGDGRLDTAVIVSEAPCTAAGVFTLNDVKAAPVLLCQEHLKAGGPFHAIIVNAGNANACTGPQGEADALEMAAITAGALGVPTEAVFVGSTGRIGRQLPMTRMRPAIAQAVEDRSTAPEAGLNAALAILTSDTRTKTVTARCDINGNTVTVAGMAKGAGMIEPNMATMLAYIATDAAVDQPTLDAALRAGVEGTFNAITVDGDMSTNDTVLILANGASGISVPPGDSAIGETFGAMVTAVCKSLAGKVVGDGERISKVVALTVQGARTTADAEKVARCIANSLLVKTSWYGSDPNWGRIIDAAGYARTGMVFAECDLFYDDTAVLVAGVPQEQNAATWKAIVSRKTFEITLDLHLGDEVFSMLATDLSEGYVDFNKSE